MFRLTRLNEVQYVETEAQRDKLIALGFAVEELVGDNVDTQEPNIGTDVEVDADTDTNTDAEVGAGTNTDAEVKVEAAPPATKTKQTKRGKNG